MPCDLGKPVNWHQLKQEGQNELVSGSFSHRVHFEVLWDEASANISSAHRDNQQLSLQGPEEQLCSVCCAKELNCQIQDWFSFLKFARKWKLKQTFFSFLFTIHFKLSGSASLDQLSSSSYKTKTNTHTQNKLEGQF